MTANGHMGAVPLYRHYSGNIPFKSALEKFEIGKVKEQWVEL